MFASHKSVARVFVFVCVHRTNFPPRGEGGGPEINFARTHTGILFFNLFFSFLFFHHILSKIWFSSFFPKRMLMAPKITSKLLHSPKKNLTHTLCLALSRWLVDANI
uniref:(northern house mosquito) hypothetical protein n=1 Tax=Culex pipiens TaxID=7175 RepID=A0A8D8DFE3_CULPI